MSEEAIEKLGAIEYFLSSLYEGWRECATCQYEQCVCPDHMYLIEPLLTYEAEKHGERVVSFQHEEDEEAEWLRDIGGQG